VRLDEFVRLQSENGGELIVPADVFAGGSL